MTTGDSTTRRQCECAVVLSGLDSLRTTKIMESLLMERLERKCHRVLELWERADRNWNQVLFSMSAYAMGAPRNGAQFEELAERVNYLTCLKERSSQRRVEALLLGVSGLLTKEFFDDYVVTMQEEYDYLTDKYSLKSMNPSVWDRRSLMPASNPVLRVVQLAALVTKECYSMDSLLALKSVEEIERMFSVAPIEYWAKRFFADGEGSAATGRIGRDKVYMLAINMVVPVQMAYAGVMGDVALRERALELLESIPAEHNRLVSAWTGYGVGCHSAYDSQALIELSTRCRDQRCAECPLAHK